MNLEFIADAAEKDILLQKILLVLHKRGLDVNEILEEAAKIRFGEKDTGHSEAVKKAYEQLNGFLEWLSKTDQKI